MLPHDYWKFEGFDVSFKFGIGEIVQMVMGRAVYSHFDGELAVITKRDRSNGCEYYRMNPLNPNLQQNICFSVGNLRKIENGLPEPLSEVHINHLDIDEEFIPGKVVELNKKFWQFMYKDNYEPQET